MFKLKDLDVQNKVAGDFMIDDYSNRQYQYFIFIFMTIRTNQHNKILYVSLTIYTSVSWVVDCSWTLPSLGFSASTLYLKGQKVPSPCLYSLSLLLPEECFLMGLVKSCNSSMKKTPEIYPYTISNERQEKQLSKNVINSSILVTSLCSN